MTEEWSGAVRALNTQCEYYISEINRLTQERDHWQEQYTQLLGLPESDREELARWLVSRMRRAKGIFI
jgi:hypothetical protein